MQFQVELGEKDLKELVRKELSRLVGVELTLDDIRIEVKSKQNYKSEWEAALFRARVEKFIYPKE